MEAASKSWLLFSRHREALEETPPLSKAPAGTLTCNGSDRGQAPASPPGQAQQAREQVFWVSIELTHLSVNLIYQARIKLFCIGWLIIQSSK